ncbi:MAG TPA: hypothetical protein VE954_30615 [Oligoflexus sp.]|uniref:hypothetical protein n=1 Tax=Oligoflexus sp. TaxID=1971216 RepID=UPI002D5EDBE4|nr:hypothetical protein [Oligoflexus sp.]HYX37478.1 hypothetical protein [Oligoflexus sp.]
MIKTRSFLSHGSFLLTALMLTPAAQVQAEIFTENCGIATCSIYLTRNSTKELCERLCQYSNSSTAAIAGAAATACAPIGGIGAVVCGAAGAVSGAFFIDKLQQAADKNQCLRLRYVPGVNTPTGLYSDDSEHCHD